MSGEQNEQIGLALGRVPSGLFIVTVRKGEDVNAFLASWVQQTCFEPPMLGVVIKKGRPAAALLDAGGAFAVNVIANGENDLVKHFARGFGPDENPYDGVDVERGETGVEVLPAALSSLECKKVGVAESGDHLVYLGEILAGRLREGGGDPAVHIRKSGFHY